VNLRRYLADSVWPRIPTLKIPSVNRLTLDRELRRQFGRLQPGLVLDVGAKAAPYRQYVPATSYMRLDIDPSRNPDIQCDVHDLTWQADFFDTVLAIEILEHLYDPGRAIERLHHVLRPGGVCILSTRFLYRYHPDPEDHYRFTWDSLRHLFKGFRQVEVYHHGNRAQVLWEMVNAGGRSRVVLNLLNPLIARLHSTHTKFPLGFVVYAVK
jgi:SAM-dependent methyltransferase